MNDYSEYIISMTKAVSDSNANLQAAKDVFLKNSDMSGDILALISLYDHTTAKMTEIIKGQLTIIDNLATSLEIARHDLNIKDLLK